MPEAQVHDVHMQALQVTSKSLPDLISVELSLRRTGMSFQLKEFPPRQKPASFSLSTVMDKMTERAA
jgi:hypothetical protein